MTQEYKHFRRKLDFIQYLIKEKGASIDLNQTMRCGGAWWIDNDGTQYKAINSTEFLKMLDEKLYDLIKKYGIYDVLPEFKSTIIFPKAISIGKKTNRIVEIIVVNRTTFNQKNVIKFSF